MPANSWEDLRPLPCRFAAPLPTAPDFQQHNTTRTNQESVCVCVKRGLRDGQEGQTRRSCRSSEIQSFSHQGTRRSQAFKHNTAQRHCARNIIRAALAEQHAKPDCRRQLTATDTILNTNITKRKNKTHNSEQQHAYHMTQDTFYTNDARRINYLQTK